MSYDHNVFVGHFAKCKFKNGAPRYNHWLLDETNEATVRERTEGRAGLDDLKMLRAAHYIFPEFMGDKDEFAYIMLPGYNRIDDVGRSDSQAVPVYNRTAPNVDMWISMHKQLVKVFDFENIELMYGVIVEVR